jgi:hypothetical protein
MSDLGRKQRSCVADHLSRVRLTERALCLTDCNIGPTKRWLRATWSGQSQAWMGGSSVWQGRALLPAAGSRGAILVAATASLAGKAARALSAAPGSGWGSRGARPGCRCGPTGAEAERGRTGRARSPCGKRNSLRSGRTRISEAASAKSGSWTGTGRSGPNLRRLGMESQKLCRGRPIRRGEKLNRAGFGGRMTPYWR